ncbi:dihydrofolate reductase family protein [Cohnella terricola]|uniref:Dihydrofolate reductase n=1 Tax=Cohnella terricola TaxID=1289167 RepID=A0A559JQA8_9BACL|nr:dihydrofolate reductase family protein [Cohnella terricola]TVY02043.1 dihydrofolate reductase [Cohnella terricola]
MRKVIFQMMVSLDGFVAGPNGESDWHHVDTEFIDYSIELLRSVDTLIFGRKTYELMAGYWPTVQAKANDPITADYMNNLKKIVVSKKIEKVEWENSILVNENVSEEILKLKQQNGKDIAILGSSELALSLNQLGLIDEYRIIINPIVLGNGKSLLQGIHDPFKLEIVETKTFRTGNVLLIGKEKRKTDLA